MKERIEELEKEVRSELKKVVSTQELRALRVRFFGRKSEVNQLFSQLPRLAKEERVVAGKELNLLKTKITHLLAQKEKEFRGLEEKEDLTFPARGVQRGTKHIISYVTEKICDIFQQLGFMIIEGGEIEDEWHNFDALNFPSDHPSRDAFDTFYLDINEKKDVGKFLLRCHTSPSQVRVMQEHKPPLAVISPGRVYRPDQVDASHSFMFHQVEGFCVDTKTNFSDLKGILLYFAKDFFSPTVRLRFRPHFFPFTEPSAEVDISCGICKGKGCSVCSRKGWLEILGCGMIHPLVLKHCGIDSKIYRGFAFGMGVDRIAMLKYGINDIRLFYENDVRFLNQFYEV